MKSYYFCIMNAHLSSSGAVVLLNFNGILGWMFRISL